MVCGLSSARVAAADHEGERYLVSMLGDDTNWVRNVRAADGRALLTRGRREAVRLEEVTSGERGAILRRYLACSPGGQSHIDISPTAPDEDFDQLATQYPIFRVTGSRRRHARPPSTPYLSAFVPASCLPQPLPRRSIPRLA